MSIAGPALISAGRDRPDRGYDVCCDRLADSPLVGSELLFRSTRLCGRTSIRRC